MATITNLLRQDPIAYCGRKGLGTGPGRYWKNVSTLQKSTAFFSLFTRSVARRHSYVSRLGQKQPYLILLAKHQYSPLCSSPRYKNMTRLHLMCTELYMLDDVQTGHAGRQNWFSNLVTEEVKTDSQRCFP